MDRVERLLRCGYLPSQLPPPFSSVDLATHYADVLAVWDSLSPRRVGNSQKRQPQERKCSASHERAISDAPRPFQILLPRRTYPVQLSTIGPTSFASIVAHG